MCKYRRQNSMTTPASSLQPSTDEPATIFAADVIAQAAEWVEKFKDIPASHKRRKEALQGAIQLKKAIKKFEDAATHPNGHLVGCQARRLPPPLSRQPPLIISCRCQEALREAVQGLMALGFPLEEQAIVNRFPDGQFEECNSVSPYSQQAWLRPEQ